MTLRSPFEVKSMRGTRFLPAVPFLLLAASVMLGSCIEDRGFITILANVIPTVDGDTCVVDPEGERLASGILDVALDRPREYLLFPIVENRIVTSETSPDSATVKLDRAHVKIRPDPRLPKLDFGANCPTEFEWPTQINLLSEEVQAAVFPVILGCHSALIKEAFENPADDPLYPSDLSTFLFFTIDFHLSGHRSSFRVESDPLHFPVRVCYGCLQLVEGDHIVTPLCSSVTDNPYKGNACNIAQDFGPLMCCSDDLDGGDGGLICPAPEVGAPGEG